MREGLVPTVLGTGVTAMGLALKGMSMRNKDIQGKDMLPMVAAGIIGFGLAHVLLGTIDLIEER